MSGESAALSSTENTSTAGSDAKYEPMVTRLCLVEATTERGSDTPHATCRIGRHAYGGVGWVGVGADEREGTSS